MLMKTVVILVVVSSIAAAAFGQDSAGQGRTLSIEEKIAIVKEMRAQVKDKEVEVKTAKAIEKSDGVYYQISDVSSSILGWGAWFVAVLGGGIGAMNNPVTYLKSGRGKLFIGSLTGWAVAHVAYKHYGTQIEIDKADREKLESELNLLSRRLEGLQAGFESLSAIK